MLAALQKGRIAYGVLGAACGFLVAMALVAANMPVLPGSNASAACLILTLLGALIAILVPPTWIAAVVIAVGFALFMLAFTPMTAAPIQAWVRRDSVPGRMPDAVVVLSTTITEDGLVDGTGTARGLSALEAMRQTRASILITTRPSQVRPEALSAAMEDYRRLIDPLVATSRWRVVGPVATTHHEALATSRLLVPPSSKRIIVVTSPIHTRRACATFEGVGFSVTCWPSAERRYDLNTFSGVRTRLAATADWLYERAGMIEYRWRGWIR